MMLVVVPSTAPTTIGLAGAVPYVGATYAGGAYAEATGAGVRLAMIAGGVDGEARQAGPE